RLGEFKELSRHLDAHCMQPEILRAGMTASGAEKARERPLRAGLQRLAIDVPLARHGLLLWPFLHPRDCARWRRGLEGSAGLASYHAVLLLGQRLWRVAEKHCRNLV